MTPAGRESEGSTPSEPMTASNKAASPVTRSQVRSREQAEAPARGRRQLPCGDIERPCASEEAEMQEDAHGPANMLLIVCGCVGSVPDARSQLFETAGLAQHSLLTDIQTGEASCAAEPVFTIAEDWTFQHFRCVFRTGFVDPALLNAVMLSLAIATTKGKIDGECLGYRGQAISHIRERVSHRNEATTESAIGAILLLAGVETREALPADFFDIPTGFQLRSHLFNNEFLEVFKDVRALQWIRDHPIYSRNNPADMALINDQTASIQSRLAGLRHLQPTMGCFRLAAYICSVMLCCSVWCAAVFPSEISSQLLRVLQQTNNESLWDDDPDLLLWTIYIGGTFAPRGTVRSSYVALLRSNHAARFKGLYTSWPGTLGVLKQFVWSDGAFLVQVRAFWDEVQSLDGQINQSGFKGVSR
ncbi:hypothetical protein PG994_014116 [Apiospora phragmitis]|uniref:Uncharacterized protein n=1 Tax=Apiospora phragmitis TaxID=2905665 RepID=A0ABR1T3E4_9PEZI